MECKIERLTDRYFAQCQEATIQARGRPIVGPMRLQHIIETTRFGREVKDDAKWTGGTTRSRLISPRTILSPAGEHHLLHSGAWEDGSSLGRLPKHRCGCLDSGRRDGSCVPLGSTVSPLMCPGRVWRCRAAELVCSGRRGLYAVDLEGKVTWIERPSPGIGH